MSSIGTKTLYQFYEKPLPLFDQKSFDRKSFVRKITCSKLFKLSPNNLVLKEKQTGTILGYQSFLIQNQGSVVLQQAIRVDPKIRGKGIGTKFNQMGEQYVKERYPNVRKD